MITIAVIGILAAIGVAQYQQLTMKSIEAATKGNLGSIRSALSIYYSDNAETYPADNLDSLQAGTRYLPLIPAMQTILHPKNPTVTIETVPGDGSGWSYNNDDSTRNWGAVAVRCTHSDLKGDVWTSF